MAAQRMAWFQRGFDNRGLRLATPFTGASHIGKPEPIEPSHGFSWSAPCKQPGYGGAWLVVA
jgi:hypothetical protein